MPTYVLDEEVCALPKRFLKINKLMLNQSKLRVMLESEGGISKESLNNGCHL